MSHSSAPELLALHGARLRGFAGTESIAQRFGLGVTEAATVLQDAQRRGWAVHTAFAANDHTDPSWDLSVLDELERLAQHLAPLAEVLAGQ